MIAKYAKFDKDASLFVPCFPAFDLLISLGQHRLIMLHFESGPNRPFSYSEKNLNRTTLLLHFVEFSNVHNGDRSFNATRSNLVYKNV